MITSPFTRSHVRRGLVSWTGAALAILATLLLGATAFRGHRPAPHLSEPCSITWGPRRMLVTADGFNVHGEAVQPVISGRDTFLLADRIVLSDSRGFVNARDNRFMLFGAARMMGDSAVVFDTPGARPGWPLGVPEGAGIRAFWTPADTFFPAHPRPDADLYVSHATMTRDGVWSTPRRVNAPAINWDLIANSVVVTRAGDYIAATSAKDGGFVLLRGKGDSVSSQLFLSGQTVAYVRAIELRDTILVVGIAAGNPGGNTLYSWRVDPSWRLSQPVRISAPGSGQAYDPVLLDNGVGEALLVWRAPGPAGETQLHVARSSDGGRSWKTFPSLDGLNGFMGMDAIVIDSVTIAAAFGTSAGFDLPVPNVVIWHDGAWTHSSLSAGPSVGPDSDFFMSMGLPALFGPTADGLHLIWNGVDSRERARRPSNLIRASARVACQSKK